MNLKSDTLETEHKWLQETYEKRKKRVFDLGVKAIDLLLQGSETVSYRTVSVKSKEIDPNGIGIHPNTIRSNEQLQGYFAEHCTSKKRMPRRSSSLPPGEYQDAFKNIRIDRDIERVRRRYMKLSKNELVDLLINSEQYIAQNNKLWLKNEFERHQ